MTTPRVSTTCGYSVCRCAVLASLKSSTVAVRMLQKLDANEMSGMDSLNHHCMSCCVDTTTCRRALSIVATDQQGSESSTDCCAAVAEISSVPFSSTTPVCDSCAAHRVLPVVSYQVNLPYCALLDQASVY